MEVTGRDTSALDGKWEKAMIEWLLGKNDLCYDLHHMTKETNESNLQCYRVLSISTVILSPTLMFLRQKYR